MVEARYEDKSAYALRLHLYDGRIGTSGISVYGRASRCARDIDLEIAVIGASHWMSVRAGEAHLTEMLSCLPVPAGRTIAVWRPGEAAVDHEIRNGGAYRFSAELVGRESAEAYVHCLRGMVAQAATLPSEAGLRFGFPGPADGSPGAETLVWASIVRDGVRARTAHSYPSEGLVVLSSTEILLPARGREGKQRRIALSA